MVLLGCVAVVLRPPKPKPADDKLLASGVQIDALEGEMVDRPALPPKKWSMLALTPEELRLEEARLLALKIRWPSPTS